MRIRSIAALWVAALGWTLRALDARAAGTKTGGNEVVVDDLWNGAAGAGYGSGGGGGCCTGAGGNGAGGWVLVQW